MAKKTGGLGKSFFDILDDNLSSTNKGAAEMLRISSIEPRGDQPRKTFEREALEQLADSIAVYGVLQPIIVRATEVEESYEIIAGERRWRAAKMAGLSEIPAVILDGDELRAAQVSLIENIQREDLNAVEEALAYSALMERFSLTQEQVAKQVGKSRSAVANMLRLLDLPDEVLEMLRAGDLSAGHARALLGLENDEDVIAIAHRIVANDLAVRDVENLVKKLNAKPEMREIDEAESSAVMTRIYMRELERKSMAVLGRRVRIVQNAKKKTIELSFDDNEDLETLLKQLCGDTIFDEN